MPTIGELMERRKFTPEDKARYLNEYKSTIEQERFLNNWWFLAIAFLGIILLFSKGWLHYLGIFFLIFSVSHFFKWYGFQEGYQWGHIHAYDHGFYKALGMNEKEESDFEELASEIKRESQT